MLSDGAVEVRLTLKVKLKLSVFITLPHAVT